ncbi:hypothetical protein GCM10027098_38830 [Bowmanella dokdonensis]
MLENRYSSAIFALSIMTIISYGEKDATASRRAGVFGLVQLIANIEQRQVDQYGQDDRIAWCRGEAKAQPGS